LKGVYMRRAFVLAAVATALWTAPTSFGADATVSVTANGFNPATVTIEQGESVTWRNTDSQPHRVVVQGTECNLSLQPNQSSSCTFGVPETLSYRDPGETGTGFRGTINVERAPERRVSLDAGIGQDNIVVFGGSLTLTGFVSSNQSSEAVTIVADPLGVDPPRRISVTTGDDGEYRLRVQPRVRTTYTAEWRGTTSRVYTALVRPRVALRRVGRNRYAVTVVAGDSFAGVNVIIRRQRSRTDNRYRYVRRVTLAENPRSETISQRTFRLRVARGLRLRAFLPDRLTGPGYLAGQSNAIRA
jgi:plastocyanin